MILNVQKATDGEILEITKFLEDNFENLSNLDYYISNDMVMCNVDKIRIAFLNVKGKCSFLEITMGGDRFDINYPEGDLQKILVKIAEKVKNHKLVGKSFSEKLSQFLNR